MTVLDTLSGFEFEDVMEDVFRKLGYQNVRQSEKTGDEGRDILMEERVNGQQRGIVVECKHKNRVGRPVVQRLHSAVTTYDFNGPKRGMIVTTGTFTDQAREYVQKLQKHGDGTQIELIDGTDLRNIADDVGLDLYNGRIEIVCNQTLRPIDAAGELMYRCEKPFKVSKISTSVTSQESIRRFDSSRSYRSMHRQRPPSRRLWE